MKKASNQTRLQTAFEVAESKLGIARLLDPEDVDVAKPDERSIMTYVAQFLHKYPEPQGQKTSRFSSTQDQFNNLVKWLEEKTNRFDILIQTNRLSEDFNDYLTEDYENRSKIPAYVKVLGLVKSHGNADTPINSDEILESLWEKLETQMLYWLWMLDSKLPNNLKTVGKWLSDAEKLLRSNDTPTDMNEETASIISRKLEDHKQFFLDMPNIVELFSTSKTTIPENSVNKQQIRNMEQRLAEIVPKAAKRRIYLKFLEHKCCLIAFLNLVENKLKCWTAKYGHQEKVQLMLDQYTNFVSKNKIFQEFEKAFIDMQQVVEEYKKDGNITKQDEIDIANFMRNTELRWKKLSVELRCTQNMLEEVNGNWKRWNAMYPELLQFIEEAEHQLQKGAEDANGMFFNDIASWKDKHRELVDTGNFLVTTCEEPIATEIKQSVMSITNRCEKIFNQSIQVALTSDIFKQRKEFQFGLEKLSMWLRTAEQFLNQPQLCNIDEIRAFGQDILNLQKEIDTIEEVFKEVSRVFQLLIQDLTREEVDKYMHILKSEKDALISVRAIIPSKIHLYHQLIVQYESLEAGQKDLSNWISDAEALLKSHSLNGGPTQIEERLENHQSFFSKMLYYRAMLDSKNNLLNQLEKNIASNGNSTFPNLRKNMNTLKERFENIEKISKHWTTSMDEVLQLWNNYQESHKMLLLKINTAEELLSETPVDVEQSLIKQKLFFEQLNCDTLQNMGKCVQEILEYVPEEERKQSINDNFTQMTKRWKEICDIIPTRIASLEFQVCEKSFYDDLKIWEHELSNEFNALLNKEDIDGIYQNYMKFFKNPTKKAQMETVLSKMKTLATQFPESSMLDGYNKAKHKYTTIISKVDELAISLNKIPQQWEQYHKEFQDMVNWMDMVEQNLESITTEVDTMEQFEKEKTIFQVSTKRYILSILHLS